MTESSHLQTCEWRKVQPWYNGGKRTECEKYQFRQIKSITGFQPAKSGLRIHKLKDCIEDVYHPFNREDGFEYTETFDGEVVLKGKTILFNLKFVCGRGGAQTRTLKQVYDFIKSQRNVLDKVTIINILDGDECHRNADKFSYLADSVYKPHFINTRVFIGDMARFTQWWLRRICLQQLTQ